MYMKILNKKIKKKQTLKSTENNIQYLCPLPRLRLIRSCIISKAQKIFKPVDFLHMMPNYNESC